MVVFVIPGNMGGYIQIPPILNALENYTDYLNSQQQTTHVYLEAFGFDFEA